MAITLKQIAAGSLAVGGTLMTTDVAANKVQVITSMRIVNKHASAAVTLNVSVGASSSEALVAPKDLSLGAGQAYLDETEIVLKTSDHLKLVSGTLRTSARVKARRLLSPRCLRRSTFAATFRSTKSCFCAE